MVSPEKPSFGSKLNVPSGFTVTVPSAEPSTSSNVAGASPGSSFAPRSPVTVWPNSPVNASSRASGCSSGCTSGRTHTVTVAVSVSSPSVIV